jgi:hypothetical protein
LGKRQNGKDFFSLIVIALLSMSVKLQIDSILNNGKKRDFFVEQMLLSWKNIEVWEMNKSTHFP